MGVRKYLDCAQGELISARRRAELKQHSKEVIYNMEVLIRAVSRVKDQVQQENHEKKRIQAEEETKAVEEARKAHSRTKGKKAQKKSQRKAKERTRKIAA